MVKNYDFQSIISRSLEEVSIYRNFLTIQGKEKDIDDQNITKREKALQVRFPKIKSNFPFCSGSGASHYCNSFVWIDDDNIVKAK